MPEMPKMPTPEGEKKYDKEHGLDVHYRSRYFRHTEKGESTAANLDGTVPDTLISNKGAKDALILGLDRSLGEPAKDGQGVRFSGKVRTKDTVKRIIEANSAGTDSKDLGMMKEELLIDVVESEEEFLTIYAKRHSEEKAKKIKEDGIGEEDFKKLSTTQQAEIVEVIEDLILAEWLENPDSELAQACPPKKVAAKIATLVQDDIEMPKIMRSGSEVDIFNGTHQGITEPLLMEIIKLPNGEKPKKLEEIGGALGLLDGWELDIKTGEEGEKQVKLFIYRVDRSLDTPKFVKKEYDIDLERLKFLAKEGDELLKKENNG